MSTRPIRKAIIPVAGLGTRMLPATKAIPKELLPVGDKPVIQHVVEEAVSAGIEEIILVTRWGKEAIENHFDVNFELEHMLSAKGKTEALKSVNEMIPSHIEVVSIRQAKALGLGHAVLCVAHLIAGEPFCVMLPDVLVMPPEDGSDSDLKRMVNAWNDTGAAQIMVEEVPENMASLYGIVDCGGNNPEVGQSSPIRGMIEKPKEGTAPSNLAVIGRYLLPAEIMDILENTPPGAGNEIQLTDAMDTLLKSSPMAAYSMKSSTYDCGNKAGYLKANIAVGLNHPETQDEVREFLQHLKV
jgi:UTP--glucose-1-phosphate uridylyltransferase